MKSKSGEPPPPRPVLLSRQGADILTRIERLMDEASHSLGPPPSTVSADRKKQAAAPHTGDALASSLEGRALEHN